MSQTDDMCLDLKHRLRDLLPDSPDLQCELIVRIWQLCSQETRTAMRCSMSSFFRIPDSQEAGVWNTALCLHYVNDAVICQANHWANLDELSKLVYQLAGISDVFVRGRDLSVRCRMKDGKWLRWII